MAQVGTLKLQRVATRIPAQGEVYESWWELLVYDFDAEDPSLRFAAGAQAPVVVNEVKHVVLEAFDGTVDVGDGSDDDHWIDQLDIAEGTAGDMTSSLLATNAGAKAGRYYTTSGEVAVTVTGGTAGKGLLLVHLTQIELS